jgi:hypothetical protein
VSAPERHGARLPARPGIAVDGDVAFDPSPLMAVPALPGWRAQGWASRLARACPSCGLSPSADGRWRRGVAAAIAAGKRGEAMSRQDRANFITP